MFWNIMTALQDTKDWGPIPDDQWMDPTEDTTPPPPPPAPDPDGDGSTRRLRRKSHKDDSAIDTPEIQGEEE